MQFVGADANLGAEAVFEAVGELGRGVDHYRTRIDFAQKSSRMRNIFGDDGVGVMRAEGVDVRDCIVDVIDDAHRQNRIEIFAAPIVLARFAHSCHQRARLFAAAQFDAGVAILLRQLWQHGVGDVAVNQQGFHRPADAVPARLGVVGDGNRLVQIGVRVDVYMANAGRVFDDRHARLQR